MGAVSKSQKKRLTMYSSAIMIGYIGIKYGWERHKQGTPFYRYNKARLHRHDSYLRICGVSLK